MIKKLGKFGKSLYSKPKFAWLPVTILDNDTFYRIWLTHYTIQDQMTDEGHHIKYPKVCKAVLGKWEHE